MLGSENRHLKLWMSSHRLGCCTLNSFLILLPSRSEVVVSRIQVSVFAPNTLTLVQDETLKGMTGTPLQVE